MLGFKSFYFDNLNSEKGFEFFDMNCVPLEFSSKSIENVLKFLNGETFYISSQNIFELIDLSSYFMIDNLSALLEIELEGLISNFDILIYQILIMCYVY